MEYRIDIKVRNNIILSKIEKAGYKSIPQFCREIGISYGPLNDLIGMKRSAFNSKGEWTPWILKIADALSCSPENLFTESQLNAVLKTNKKTLQVNEAEMRFMLEADEPKSPEELYLEDQRSAAIEDLMKTLTPREQKVISMRLGLGKYTREYTFEEISLEFECTRERIRQIEQKAYRKMRSPHRANKLLEFVEK